MCSDTATLYLLCSLYFCCVHAAGRNCALFAAFVSFYNRVETTIEWMRLYNYYSMVSELKVKASQEGT